MQAENTTKKQNRNESFCDPSSKQQDNIKTFKGDAKWNETPWYSEVNATQ